MAELAMEQETVVSCSFTCHSFDGQELDAITDKSGAVRAVLRRHGDHIQIVA